MKSWQLFLHSRWLWPTLLGIGLGLRLGLALCFYGNFDQVSYEIVAEIMRRGGNVYAETSRYNYTPLWSYVLLILNYGAIWLRVPFHVMVRSFIICIDLINMLLIGYVAANGLSRNLKVAAVGYWLNPVAILLVGYHGQFENLATLPLLLAVALYCRPIGRPRTLWLWGLGTLALIIKHNTLFSVWMLFAYVAGSWRRAGFMMILAICAFLATFTPYLPAGLIGIVKNVLTYQSALPYGFGQFFPSLLSALLFAGVMLLLPVIAKQILKTTLPHAIGFSAVGLLTFIFGISVQYYLLPVIWGSLTGGIWYWIYSVSITFLLLSNINSLAILNLPPLYNLAWLVTSIWFFSYFGRRFRPQHAVSKNRSHTSVDMPTKSY